MAMTERADQDRPDITISEVDSTPLDLNDDIFDVKREIITVAARWRDVGIALRLKYDALDNIETKCSNDPHRALELMVKEWLKRNYNVRKFGEPTWQKLVEAVNSPAGGANTALARGIAGRHQAGDIETRQPKLVRKRRQCSQEQPKPLSGKRKKPNEEQGQLTSLMEAGPPTSPPLTPPTPLTPPSSVDPNSPQHSPSVGGLPSQPPANLLEGAYAQPLSLEEEIDQFEKKYEDLVNYVLSAFKTVGISFRRVLNCLRQLPVSLKLQCSEFLQSQAARLSRVSNIDELFFILSPYWDFLNPSLLAHLANRFGDDQTIRSVEEYLGELREFRIRTKIGDFIDKWTGTLPLDNQEIVVELGDNWREKSVEQLEEFRIKFLHKCFLEDYVMPLKRIKQSSVDAIFSLPESVDICSLEIESLQNFFQEHQVLRILLNGVCILNLQLQQEVEAATAPSTEDRVEQKLEPYPGGIKFMVSDCKNLNTTEHTPLHIASEHGGQEVVNFMPQHGAHDNAQNSKLETPMHLAAGKGLEHIVKQLIDDDVEMMLCKDIRERTPLHTACRHGQTNVVRILTQSLKLLLEATDINLPEVTDSMGNTPLHLACVGGSRDCVQLLIDSNSSLNQTNFRGEAPIHIAAQRGFVPIAEVLLANGVDIECPSASDERTPLHHAAKCNQDEMIKFLCGHGSANIHAEDCNLCTPVLLAASCGHTRAFDCLMGYLDLDKIEGNPIFQMLKIKSRQEAILKFLVNNHTWGLKLRNSTAEHENNPLHVAAKLGNNLAVKVMLDLGFDARAKNVFKKTPLHLATEEGKTMVVKTFIGHDASLAMDRDENGMIPLHLASLYGKLEAVQAHQSLLSLVTVREARDSGLNTPLHLACRSGDRNVAEYLIEVGCSKNARNLNKDSLIHVAVQNGHTSVSELLLDKGVSTESLDAQKCTPVHVAAKHNRTSVIEMLKERGADLFAEDCDSFTPVLAAAVHGNTAAFHCLMESVDMSDSKQNPVFKAIEISCSWKVINFLLIDVKWGSKLQQSTDYDKNTLLHSAARHGNIAAVRVLLQLNFDTYIENCDGKLPIHLAAEEGHFRIVLEFIYHNPQLTVAQDANGRIPLHTACLSGQVEVVKTFNLSANEVLHASDSSGNTPLHLACEGRSEEVVQFLVDSGASVSEANNEGELPIHIAAHNGSINIAEKLWEKCADTVPVLCQDKYKRTTLHHAAMAKQNQGEIIEFLIQKCGVTSLYAEDQNSHTPILMAAAHRQVTAFRCFMKYVDLQSSERNPVFKILHVGWKQAEILKFMISDSEWGAILSATVDESGNTPLHVAAQDGNQEAVSVLLKLRVQVNALNKHGKTPIHLAAEHGHNLTVHQLNKHDRKLVEEQDADGRNALHLACQGGHWAVVSVLSRHMSEQVREACDSEGNRPLHLACESNTASIVNLLTDMKADTTAKNDMDEIPLHIVARKGNVQIGRLLVAGAGIKNSRGFNSLHVAAYHNQTKMIALLCDSDKSQTLLYDKDKNLCTPVLIAAASENEDAFHCLMKYVDLDDPKKNPNFMAFHVRYKKMAVLKFIYKNSSYSNFELIHAGLVLSVNAIPWLKCQPVQ